GKRIFTEPRPAQSGWAGRADVAHEETDRRIPPWLAGHLPTFATSWRRICRALPRPLDAGTLEHFADPSRYILHALSSGGIFRHGGWRDADRRAHSACRRRARRHRRFRRRPGRFRAICTAPDLLAGRGADDLGDRALPRHRLPAA